MKTVCSRHYQAYEVAEGCPWCEPVARVVPPTDTKLTSFDDVMALTRRAVFAQLHNDQLAVTPAVRVAPVVQGSQVQWVLHYAFTSHLLFNRAVLLNDSHSVFYSKEFSTINGLAGNTLTFTFEFNR